jgi:hypothetical protein
MSKEKTETIVEMAMNVPHISEYNLQHKQVMKIPQEHFHSS